MNQRNRVYAWEFPVRLTHWMNVLSILTLSVTGIYIGFPFIHATSADQYIMGTIRFVHFVAAYVLLLSLVIRIYWAFMGNRYASWKVFFPFTKQQRRNLADTFKYYTFMSRTPPHTVGHTALAGITYLFVYLIIAFEVVSGFAHYSVSHPDSLVWTLLGGWLLNVMSTSTIRLLHHVAMYLLIAFTLVHVYIAWWMDTVERNGVMGSIFGGYKFVTGKEWE